MKRRVLVAMVEYSERMDTGGRLHNRLLVEELSAIAEVTLLVIGPEPPAGIGDPARELWHPIDNRRRAHRAVEFMRGFLRGRPAVLERTLLQGGAGALARAAREVKPDLIVLQRPFYGPMLELARQFGPTIIDADESTTKVMRMIAARPPSGSARIRALMEWLVYRRLERTLERASEVWVTSPVEAHALRRSVGGIRTRVVPNVVDSAAFEAIRGFPLGSTGAAFLGGYSYAPNEEAALWIIRELGPVFADRSLGTIDLVGKAPTARMTQLAGRQVGVRVMGELASPWPAVRATGSLIVPLRTGAGTRWKVLEAAVAEVPVVSTGFGVQGLDFEPDVHYLRAETPTGFADAVQLLRTDPERRHRLIAAARALVEAKYSRSAARSAMDAGVSALTSVSGVAA